MHQVKGHALILAVGALGVVTSFEALDWTGRPVPRARAAVSILAQPPAREPALRPLPASTDQSRYTRVLVSPADREMLARGIQRELRRLGCYRGDIDGTWGPQSRQAMGAFTSAMKLQIPFEAPDEMMLRLVQGQQQRICGGPDLDPEQAAASPGAAPGPRLVQPPTEVKRAPRRGVAGDPKSPDAKPSPPEMREPEPQTRVAENPPASVARRADRAPPGSPPPASTPTLVRNLMQTVSNVLGPLGF